MTVEVVAGNPSPSAESSAAKLFLVFGRAYRSAVDYVTTAITAQGLYLGDFAVLEVLLHKGPATAATIAQKIGRTASSVNPTLDRLEIQGHVRRRRARDSMRGQWAIELTPAGQKFISDVYKTHTAAIESVLDPLSPSDRIELHRALKKIGLRSTALQLAAFKDGSGGLSPSHLRRATTYLTQFAEPTISVADVAAKLGLSPTQFARAFKASTGFPPHRWQLSQRIGRAQELLRDGSSPLAEIALATGFAEQSHFTRVFKKIVGVSPGAWQRDHEH
jgi:AraC-like DNA-binding protein/predicted transcriptional regulator